jgi:hypothetical protein
MSELASKLITDLSLEEVRDGRLCTICIIGAKGVAKQCQKPGRVACGGLGVVLCKDCLEIATDLAKKKLYEKTATPEKSHGLMWRKG